MRSVRCRAENGPASVWPGGSAGAASAAPSSQAMPWRHPLQRRPGRGVREEAPCLREAAVAERRQPQEEEVVGVVVVGGGRVQRRPLLREAWVGLRPRHVWVLRRTPGY